MCITWVKVDDHLATHRPLFSPFIGDSPAKLRTNKTKRELTKLTTNAQQMKNAASGCIFTRWRLTAFDRHLVTLFHTALAPCRHVIATYGHDPLGIYMNLAASGLWSTMRLTDNCRVRFPDKDVQPALLGWSRRENAGRRCLGNYE